MIVEVKSPAKINLHLEILNKREDGFHNLRSLFHMVDLCDTLFFKTNQKKESCRIDGPFDFPAEKNLIYKAVELFRRETGFLTGVDIEVKKQIPAGAGLGGGSSNAAFSLRAMEVLSGITLEQAVLEKMAVCLGSDVPFFLFSPAALVEGRGERLTPVTPLSNCEFWLAKPDEGINTARAFAYLAESRCGNLYHSRLEAEDLVSCFQEKKPCCWNFFNSFQDCFRVKYPQFSEWLSLLQKLDPDFLLLSGSGSCFILAFSLEQNRKDLQKRTNFSFPFLKKVFSLDCTPNPVLN